jgi:hypothetical protein
VITLSGRYQLRPSAHTGDRAGSVYYDLDVPDFSARPLSLSGIVLSSDPRPVSTPADRIKALVPIAPTARREFSARDRVTVFGRIYQGGRDVVMPTTVVVKVTDATGAVRMNRPHLLTVSDVTGTAPTLRSRVPAGDTAATTTRSVDFSMDLPLRTLPAGEYLLTVEASTARGAAKREVRFAITK